MDGWTVIAWDRDASPGRMSRDGFAWAVFSGRMSLVGILADPFEDGDA